MPATVVVDVETPLQDDVARLLRQSDALAARLYSGESRRSTTPESLAQRGTHVLVARVGGQAVGLCALVERGSGEIELKRMIVDAGARRQGVGVTLVREVQAITRRLGATVIMLEVGIRNTEAQALYRGMGFTNREVFPPHRSSPISLFMERSI